MKTIASLMTMLLSAVLLTTVHAAELKLAAVFADHMVLQCDKPVPVWGWADPGGQVSVNFGGQEKQAAADATGKWLVKLDPLKASAEPRMLVAKSKGVSNELRVADVLVGEVWLGSGQSNMAMDVSRARDFNTVKSFAQLPLIRMFKETSGAAPKPQQDAKGQWVLCAPESVGAFSATLYFFGRELYLELKVPVGLINSSVGGTPIEAWIDGTAQSKMPEGKAAVDAQNKADAALDTPQAKEQYEKQLARWKEQADQAKAAGKPAPKKPLDPQQQRARRAGAGGLFSGKIAPLVPYAIRGVLWYQGEANANPAKAPLYQKQLALLVNDWRARWGGELPFAWVQLPNFKNPAGDGWMLVREAMLKTLSLPRTGMAITIDIGDPNNIHPANKQEVGRRLSLWALGEVYNKKVAATSGPLPAGHEARGAGMVLTFTHCEGGLKARDGELKGFVIAGEDRQWQPAVARVDGDKVLVSSPQVVKPVAVRYAWEVDPACNLVNGAGLPASPFRTDDWTTPVPGKGKP